MNAAHFPMVHHIRPLASGLAALALLLAACGGSDYRFVGDGDALTYKVPKHWVEFGRDQVLRAIGLQDAQTAQAFRYLTAYDAAEEPSLQHVLRSVPEEPTLIAYVRQLGPQARDQWSLRSIRNALYPIDQLVNDDQGVYLNGQDLVLEGGFRGSQDIFEVSGGVDFLNENDVLTVNQMGVIDPATQNFYFTAISCEASCYEQNKSVIEEIADSWAVTER